MSSDHSTPRWTTALREDDLGPGEMKTVRVGAHQLVVGRTEGGEWFALDNRCPHEGYPLATGELRSCALTCAWHNWKFDVRDGSCILGGEGVRQFPVRIRGGAVEVDVADPDPESLHPALLESLREGLHRHDNGRAFRDGVRLLEAGFSPWRLLAEVARHDALRAEYGTTHVLPVAFECGRMAERAEGAEKMYALAPVIDLCGDSDAWHPVRPRPEPATEEPRGEDLRAAVEAEDAERAEAILRGAFACGVLRATVEDWLLAALSDHFLDFGHPLIYLVKGSALLDRAGDERAADIYGALLYGIVVGTREDTLPYWRPYRERLAAVEGELPAAFDRAGSSSRFDPVAARDSVLDGSVDEAFEAVWRPLQEGVAPGTIARALVGAGSHRLLRFREEVDRDPDLAEHWLWATHRFTFASAVREAVERFRSADALRFLFQAVAFIHSGRAMDRPAPEATPIQDLDLESLSAAIADHDLDRALAGLRGWLQRGESVADLRGALEDLCLRDPLVRPIVLAHAIKTTAAAFDEYDALEGHPDREIPLLAAVRFLASPIRERRVRNQVYTSIRWVKDGIVPRKLTQ